MTKDTLFRIASMTKPVTAIGIMILVDEGHHNVADSWKKVFDRFPNAKVVSLTATPLLAIGDSWLFDQWDREFGVVRANLTKSLLKLGYKDVGSGTSEITSAGRLLSGMAKAPFLRDLTNYLADEPGMKAILFGVGCNDLVAGLPGQQPLYRMLKPRGAGDDPLDEAEVSSIIDGVLSQCYDTVIKTLGIGDRLKHKPSELSGGQQQRVAVGRALATRPAIIFADEPTGNLDSRSGAEVLEFLRSSVRAWGQTVVMVTHDPVAASYAERIVFLADGRVVDEMIDPTAERVIDHMKTFEA